jgi:hypothetical protein
VDRLVETHAGLSLLGSTSERSRRKEAKRSRDDRRLVRKADEEQVESSAKALFEETADTYISPNRFSVKMTPFSFLGLEIMIIAAESTN